MCRRDTKKLFPSTNASLSFPHSFSIRKSFPLSFFFFNDTATTEIYTLSLHDALPIWSQGQRGQGHEEARLAFLPLWHRDRKSTRLNSSHQKISYAVFCFKKKKRKTKRIPGPIGRNYRCGPVDWRRSG